VTKQPKGIAYLSFEDPEDVERALHLTGTKLRGRYIKVNRKRTNIPGMSSKTSGEQQQIFFMGEMMKKFGHVAQGGRGMPRGRGKQ
jgi:RNA recognition motif-containing protein